MFTFYGLYKKLDRRCDKTFETTYEGRGRQRYHRLNLDRSMAGAAVSGYRSPRNKRSCCSACHSCRTVLVEEEKRKK